MNFQAVRQANGSNVKINAIATRIDGTTYIPSGAPKQDCLFTDTAGEQQKVTIWQGKGQPIPPQRQGQTLSILISCKQNGEYLNYGGFWDSRTQTRQQAPQQQAPPQQAPQANKPDWDAISRGKVRHGVVCALLSSRGLENMPDIPEIEQWVDYIMTGEVTSWNPENLPQGRPQGGSPTGDDTSF
jgi:hypothetical protein